MKKNFCIWVMTIVLIFNLNLNASEIKESLLVSTSWLAENLYDSSYILLHVGPKTEYEKHHIPGAILFPIRDIFDQPASGLAHEMSSTQKLDSTFEALGITNNSSILLYFGENWLSLTTRVFLSLDLLGLGEKTAILDGGFHKWLEEEHPVTKDIPNISKGEFTPLKNENLMIDSNWLEKNIDNPNVVIVDARPEELYDGSEKMDRIDKYGHIAGAINIPFPEITTDNQPYTFKSSEDLKKIFLLSGAKPGSTLVTYCDTGVWASAVYFTARYLGYDVRFYDGSFEEWNKNDLLPVTEPVHLSPSN